MDHSDHDDDAGYNSTVAPVGASRAVSTHTSTREIAHPAKQSALPTVLSITAAVLAIGVIGALHGRIHPQDFLVPLPSVDFMLTQDSFDDRFFPCSSSSSRWPPPPLTRRPGTIWSPSTSRNPLPLTDIFLLVTGNSRAQRRRDRQRGRGRTDRGRLQAAAPRRAAPRVVGSCSTSATSSCTSSTRRSAGTTSWSVSGRTAPSSRSSCRQRDTASDAAVFTRELSRVVV